MLKEVKSLPGDPPGPGPKLTQHEWVVLRACCRLGPGATTGEIAAEVIQHAPIAYRGVESHLRRIAEKGYATPEREGRRELWTPHVSQQAILSEQLKRVFAEILGHDRQLVWLMRKALRELEDELDSSEVATPALSGCHADARTPLDP